ncbi:MAG TPA: hypothetical protein PK114_06225, partial [Smithellaceae bacterium]|nr:hypothetical protein [Smithellaceae bacterium]
VKSGFYNRKHQSFAEAGHTPSPAYPCAAYRVLKLKEIILFVKEFSGELWAAGEAAERLTGCADNS